MLLATGATDGQSKQEAAPGPDGGGEQHIRDERDA